MRDEYTSTVDRGEDDTLTWEKIEALIRDLKAKTKPLWYGPTEYFPEEFRRQGKNVIVIKDNEDETIVIIDAECEGDFLIAFPYARLLSEREQSFDATRR